MKETSWLFPSLRKARKGSSIHLITIRSDTWCTAQRRAGRGGDGDLTSPSQPFPEAQIILFLERMNFRLKDLKACSQIHKKWLVQDLNCLSDWKVQLFLSLHCSFSFFGKFWP